MVPNVIGQLFILAILLTLSAFFSASETSLMALSKIRIRNMVEKKVEGADIINSLIKNPGQLLSSILVGNNIVNIGASALATSIAFQVEAFRYNPVGIATVIMTILVLIFAEITPKSIAAQHSEKLALKVAKPIRWVVVVLNPIVIILNRITSILIRMLGGKKAYDKPFITEEELRTMVNVSHEEGVLEVEEKQMIQNVFEFGDLQIKDVMVQRTDVIAIDVQDTYEEMIHLMKEEQFSRYPVYDQHLDDIVGILNVRDLFLVEGLREDFDVRRYMRKPHYTFEFKKISELFKEMKNSRVHMDIVLDEYGGTAGIVTMEDLIEEIVGEIEDEYDEIYEEIQVIKEDEFVVDGSAKITLVNEMLGIHIESEDFDSIGGFIIGELRRFPKQGEVITKNNVKFVVEEIYKNRIQKIRVFT
ncbi:protein of unknown function DUF21 [Alkaliphilus metalliredigens QYMF]|uniref:CBS domain containing protein n=1 Tax=Alkaliphilus metalliredigens (strain QYMF) TaxID=293826 RepID=A6TWB1_ALKMQ|nr:hemolysin family protein [Alkaliphilus metalliredigens]ABR50479.1 protein of unknown function DUF21 [Alkaliphilus metalliredigens QYMF]